MVIQKFNSITKKKKRKHDKIVLLEKAKPNTIEVLISKALIASCITNEKFAWINNVLKKYDYMKKEIKNPSNKYIWYNKKKY